MKKFLMLLSALALLAATNPALARQDKAPKYAPDSESAAEDGTYDVPGHSELKVRVHVYKQDARGNSQKQKPGGGGSLVLQCNLPDIGSASAVPSAGWHLSTSTPIVYRLNVSSAPGNVGSGNLSAIAANSFSQWAAATGGSVAFSPGGNTTVSRARYDGQNIIAWGRTSAGALAVTYTTYYTATNEVADVDTIFNSSYSWAWSNPALWATPAGTTCAYKNVYDAQDILTHELGHWMGLNDIYTAEFTDNTMFGYGSTTETKKDTLTAGDIAGIQSIY